MISDVLTSNLVHQDDVIASGLYVCVRNYVQQALAAHETQHNQDAVDHFGLAIQEVNEKIMAVLLAHRARSFEEMQQYDDMLADAERVIEFFPTSAHGYIQAGRACYKKQQLRDALLVYDAGLETVAADDPLYQTMASLKESLAAEIHERNLRQLGRIPYDIVCQIFSQVSIVDRIRCTLTCEGWRNMLLNWHDMWTKVDLRRISCIRASGCIAQIDRQNLKELSLDCWSVNRHSKLFEALAQKRFNQLRKLEMSLISDIPYDPFASFLQMNCQNLTALALEIQDESCKRFLELSLQICRNITRLKLESHVRHGFRTLEIPEQRFKLTHLQFRCTNNEHTYEFTAQRILESLLPRCPDLRFFATTPESFEDGQSHHILGLVNMHCPSLRQLQLVDEKYACSHPELCFTESNDCSIVTLTEVPYLEEELVPMLSRERLTLDILRLDLSCTINTHRVLASVASIDGFQQLREIDLTEKKVHLTRDFTPYSEYEYAHHESESESEDEHESESESEDEHESGYDQLNCEEIALIIGHCPLLQTVRLADFRLSDNVIECLGHLKHLRHLELIGCEDMTPAAMSQFFQRAAALQIFAYQECCMSWNQGELYFAEVLRAISESPLKTLRELRLLPCLSYSEEDLADFARAIKDSRLSRIVSRGGYTTQEKLQIFMKIPSLRTLSLEDNDDVDVFEALECREEPICVLLKADHDRAEDRNGTYIKDKEGHVQHYPYLTRRHDLSTENFESLPREGHSIR